MNGDGNITENELSDWIKYISLKESSDKTGKVFLEDYSKATKEDGLLSWQEFMNINYPGTGKVLEFWFCCLAIPKSSIYMI